MCVCVFITSHASFPSQVIAPVLKQLAGDCQQFAPGDVAKVRQIVSKRTDQLLTPQVGYCCVFHLPSFLFAYRLVWQIYWMPGIVVVLWTRRCVVLQSGA